MAISLKPDYSYLMSGLSNARGSSPANLNFLSDYMSIKNGSYGKVMKAYYQNTGKESEGSSAAGKPGLSTSLSSDSAKTLVAVESSADKLKESADALINKGKDSLFNQKDVTVKNEDGTTTTTKQYDKDAIYKAAYGFVKNYNALLNAASKSDSSGISNSVRNMTNLTNVYSHTLEKIGITVGFDKKLSIDEKAFKSADISTLKSVLNESPSFAYSTSSQASFIGFTAGREAEKANTYNGFGTYNNNYSMGNIFNGFF